MLPAYLDLPRCEEISDRLSEFLDDELDEATRQRVTVHLAICPTCARLATELAATIQALRGLRGSMQVARVRRPR
ncbi:MAG: anti-sigma factor family protein [Myxococcales bacterium]